MAKKQRNKNISHINAIPTLIRVKGVPRNSQMHIEHRCETCGYVERDPETNEIIFKCDSAQPIATKTIDGKIHRRCLEHVSTMPKQNPTPSIMAQINKVINDGYPTLTGYSHSTNRVQHETPPVKRINRDASGAIVW